MATAAELRTEAARLRAFLGRVSDPNESAAIQAMISAYSSSRGVSVH
jgi:hypothetical protein